MATTKITNPNLFDLSTVNTALRLPNGDNATRPTSASQGEWRFNTERKYVEFYDGNNWFRIDTEPTCTTNTVDYPTTNLAYYKLDSSAADQTTNNHDGTSTDITYYNGQQYSQGAVFNGTSSVILLPDAIETPIISSSEFSVSMWFKTTTVSTEQFLIRLYQNMYLDTRILSSGTLTARVSNSAGTNSACVGTTNLSTNTWNHFCFTGKVNDLKLYLNGSLEATNTSWDGTFFTSTSTQPAIGARGVPGAEFFFSGSIDQVRIFSSELTASQVTTELYNEVQCPCTTDDNNNPTTNVAYYKLDGNANDATNTYNGTWNGSEAYEYGPYGIAASGFSISNFINIPAIADVIDTDASDDFTFSIWFKLNAIPASSSNFNTICGNLNANTSGDNAQMWEVNLFGTSTTNEIEIRTRRGYGGNVYDPSSYGITKVVAAGRWYNLVCAYTGSTKVIEIYIDGVSLGSNTLNSATLKTLSNGFNLGAYSTDSGYSAFAFNGVLDQVRIFSDVLSATQITSLYDEVYCNTVSTLNIFNEGTSSCLALYEFEDDAKSTDSDTYDGTWSGTEAYGGGQYKKAGIFNGSTSIISIPQPTLSGGFSLSAWFNTTSSGFQSIITMGGTNGVAAAGLNLFTNSGNVITSFGNGSTESYTTTPGTVINTGEWFHALITTAGLSSGDTVNLYINGALGGTGTVPAGGINTTSYTSAFSIGGRNMGGTLQTYFDGSIDQVRIFNKELTATEVLQVYTE